MTRIVLATVTKPYVDNSVASLSTSTSTALSSVLGGSLGVMSSSVASLSTSTSTGLSSTNSALDSLSTLVGSGGGSTDLTSINSSVASLSTSTSTSLSATNSAVSSLSSFRYITKTPSGGDISIELNSLISTGVLCIGIPEGTYDASTPIIMKSGLDITGAGWERTVIQPKTVFSGIFTTQNQVVSNAKIENFSIELKRPTTNLIGDFVNVFNLTRFIYSRVENLRVFTATADVSEGVFKVRMVASADALNARSNTFKNLVVISPTVTDTGTGNAAARLGFPNNVTGMTFDESGNNNYVSNCAFTGCRFPVKLGSGVNGNHFVGNSFEKFETGFSLNGAWQNNFFMQRNELGINVVEILGAGTAPLGRNNHFYGFDYITIDNRWSALTPTATQNFQMISSYDSTSTPFLRVTTGMQGNLPMSNNGIQLAGYTGYTNLTSFTNPNAVAFNIAVVSGEPYFTYSSGNRFALNYTTALSSTSSSVNSSVASLSTSTSTSLVSITSSVASLSTSTSTALSSVLNGSSSKDLIKRYTWTTTVNQTWNSGTSFILGETILAGSPTLTTFRDLPYLGAAVGGTPAAPNGTFSEFGTPNGYFKMNNTVTKRLIIDLRFQISPGSVQDIAVKLIKWDGTAWVDVAGATRKAARSNDAIAENSTNFVTFSTGATDGFNTGVFAIIFVNQSGTNLSLPPQEVILTFFN